MIQHLKLHSALRLTAADDLTLAQTLATLDDNLRIIREAFGGSIEAAQDLACYEL